PAKGHPEGVSSRRRSHRGGGGWSGTGQQARAFEPSGVVIAGGYGGIAFGGFVAVVFQIAVRVETGHAAQKKGGKCEAGPFHALRVPTALALDGCRGGSRNRKRSGPAECEFD